MADPLSPPTPNALPTTTPAGGPSGALQPPPSTLPAGAAVGPTPPGRTVFPDPSPDSPPEPPLVSPSRGSLVLAALALLGMVVVIVVLIATIALTGYLGWRALDRRPARPALATAPGPGRTPAVAPSSADPSSATPSSATPPGITPLSAVPAPAPASPDVPTVTPSPPAAAPAGPWIASMTPTTGGVGQVVVLRGHDLAAVENVVLFPEHGGDFAEAATFDVSDRQVTFPIPAVDRPDGFRPGDGYYVAVFAKTGACLFADRSLSTTPKHAPTDAADAAPDAPPSHAAVRVRPGKPLVGGDHLLVFADAGSTVTVGAGCVLFLGPDCTLAGYGPGCKVFYQGPLHTTAGLPAADVPVDGITPLPSVRLHPNGSRLFLNALPPATEPADDGK